MTSRFCAAVLMAACMALLQGGCATQASIRQPDLAPLKVGAPASVDDDHFRRDRGGGVGEEELRAILRAPVQVDETQRLGVLQVTDAYLPQRSVPVPSVPAELTRSLESAGLFAGVSEMAADWPSDQGLPGLRELAARYRSGYLLLYRHRFVDDAYENAWAWLYPTIIGIFVAPARTLETAGVLEATLFDVRTGTILFTAYERVRAKSNESCWHEDRKLREMRSRLIDEAAGKLAEQVVSKVRLLTASPRRAGDTAAPFPGTPSS
jgi:hypothetical protein